MFFPSALLYHMQRRADPRAAGPPGGTRDPNLAPWFQDMAGPGLGKSRRCFLGGKPSSMGPCQAAS